MDPREPTLHDRSQLRYESDPCEAEWGEVAPLIPPAKRGDSERTVDIREVANGIVYILSTGCQWRALPKDLPPRSTSMGILSDGRTTALWSA